MDIHITRPDSVLPAVVPPSTDTITAPAIPKPSCVAVQLKYYKRLDDGLTDTEAREQLGLVGTRISSRDALSDAVAKMTMSRV